MPRNVLSIVADVQRGARALETGGGREFLVRALNELMNRPNSLDAQEALIIARGVIFAYGTNFLQNKDPVVACKMALFIRYWMRK